MDKKRTRKIGIPYRVAGGPCFCGGLHIGRTGGIRQSGEYEQDRQGRLPHRCVRPGHQALRPYEDGRGQHQICQRQHCPLRPRRDPSIDARFRSAVQGLLLGRLDGETGLCRLHVRQAQLWLLNARGSDGRARAEEQTSLALLPGDPRHRRGRRSHPAEASRRQGLAHRLVLGGDDRGLLHLAPFGEGAEAGDVCAALLLPRAHQSRRRLRTAEQAPSAGLQLWCGRLSPQHLQGQSGPLGRRDPGPRQGRIPRAGRGRGVHQRSAGHRSHQQLTQPALVARSQRRARGQLHAGHRPTHVQCLIDLRADAGHWRRL